MNCIYCNKKMVDDFFCGDKDHNYYKDKYLDVFYGENKFYFNFDLKNSIVNDSWKLVESEDFFSKEIKIIKTFSSTQEMLNFIGKAKLLF